VEIGEVGKRGIKDLNGDMSSSKNGSDTMVLGML
jgi:hypothetical protein